VQAHNAPLDVDYNWIQIVVEKTLGHLIKSLAKYVAAFDVDLVILCGKPSELPVVRRLVERLLPIAQERIILARGFHAGIWYPFLDTDGDGSTGRIADAKTVTCVGGALSRAIRNGQVTGWQLTTEVSSEFSTRNWWGAISRNNVRFAGVYLRPEENRKDGLRVISGTFVGRRLMASGCRPEPVYRLRFTDPNRSAQAIQICLTRESDPQHPEHGESLRLVAAKDEKTGADLLGAGAVELQLCPSAGDRLFWQDSGQFDMDWDFLNERLGQPQ
jgi:hypothetical protein